jgi:hypothetical protein
MNAWEFMGEHPILTFFLATIVAHMFTHPFKLINRWIRHRNIAIAGWPPDHLDADGDVHRKESDSNSACL